MSITLVNDMDIDSPPLLDLSMTFGENLENSIQQDDIEWEDTEPMTDIDSDFEIPSCTVSFLDEEKLQVIDAEIPNAAIPSHKVKTSAQKQKELLYFRNWFRNWYNTLYGRMHLLATHCQTGAKGRLAKGRGQAGICTITKNDLLDIWNKQQGKDYYTKVIPMSTITGADWLVSPERLDPSGGYTIDNVCLCALEFNGRAQWTLAKIAQLPQLIQQEVDLLTLQKQIEKAHDQLQHPGKIKPNRNHEKHPDNQRKHTIRNGIQFLECVICKKMLPITEFHKKACDKLFGVKSVCKEDRRKQEKERRNEFLDYLKNLLYRCKPSTKHRNGKRTRDGELRHMDDVTLTIHDLLEMVWTQGGRCSISNIPLIFNPNSDWQCSIERLDNSKTYTRENCTLICLEFNTRQQWTKEKFGYVLSTLSTAKNDNDAIMATGND